MVPSPSPALRPPTPFLWDQEPRQPPDPMQAPGPGWGLQGGSGTSMGLGLGLGLCHREPQRCSRLAPAIKGWDLHAANDSS